MGLLTDHLRGGGGQSGGNLRQSSSKLRSYLNDPEARQRKQKIVRAKEQENVLKQEAEDRKLSFKNFAKELPGAAKTVGRGIKSIGDSFAEPATRTSIRLSSIERDLEKTKQRAANTRRQAIIAARNAKTEEGKKRILAAANVQKEQTDAIIKEGTPIAKSSDSFAQSGADVAVVATDLIGLVSGGAVYKAAGSVLMKKGLTRIAFSAGARFTEGAATGYGYGYADAIGRGEDKNAAHKQAAVTSLFAGVVSVAAPHVFRNLKVPVSELPSVLRKLPKEVVEDVMNTGKLWQAIRSVGADESSVRAVNDARSTLASYGADVKPKAGPKDLKKSYLEAAHKSHPDMGGSHDEFVAVTKAYNTLVKNKDNRAWRRSFINKTDDLPNPVARPVKQAEAVPTSRQLGDGAEQATDDLNNLPAKEAAKQITGEEKLVDSTQKPIKTTQETTNLPQLTDGKPSTVKVASKKVKDAEPGEFVVVTEDGSRTVTKSIDEAEEVALGIRDQGLGNVTAIEEVVDALPKAPPKGTKYQVNVGDDSFTLSNKLEAEKLAADFKSGGKPVSVVEVKPKNPKRVSAGREAAAQTKLTKRADEAFATERGSQVHTMLTEAEAGRRIFADGEQLGTQGSSFPDFLPDDLRNRKVIDSALKHLDAGTVPPKSHKRVRDAYELIIEEMESDRPLRTVGSAKAVRQGGFSYGANASYGEFADNPVQLGDLPKIKPVEMPELVRLARDLTETIPKLKKFPKARGMFYPTGKGGIAIHPDLFKPENVNQLSKTMAHEIGHLIDYLPEQSLSRGNLLGRLKVMRKNMKNTLDGEITTNKELKKELIALSEYWRPYDKKLAPDGFIKYRESSRELYADAVSTLLNSPGTVEKKAPKFYDLFFNNLDKKPDVKREYLNLLKMLNGKEDDLLKRRAQDQAEMFVEGKAARQKVMADGRRRKRSAWNRLRQDFEDKYRPVTQKYQELERQGKQIPDEENINYIIDEANYADNDNVLMVKRVDEEVMKPLEADGITDVELGSYLFNKRVAGRKDAPKLDKKIVEQLEEFDPDELAALRKSRDRKDVANPLGFDEASSTQQIEFLRKQMGDEKFSKLESAAEKFHDIMFERVEEAVKVGAYSKEMFEKVIKPNKNFYVTFGAMNHLQSYVPSGIKAQVGTLGKIENPFTTTLLKTTSLNKVISRQRTLNAWRDMMKKNFSDEIAESATTRLPGGRQQFKEFNSPKRVQMLEDGKVVGYDVDPYMAEVLGKPDLNDTGVVVELMSKFNNKIFKPTVLTYNLAFALYNNPIRDFFRNKRNLRAVTGKNVNVVQLAKAYLQAVPDAVAATRGINNDTINAMLKERAIAETFIDYSTEYGEDEAIKLLRKNNFLPKAEVSSRRQTVNKIMSPVTKLMSGMKFMGNTLEIMPKIAGYNTLTKSGIEGKARAYATRNYVGTPNFRRGGTKTRTTNEIFTFSNVFIQGTTADLRLASKPGTRAGFWMEKTKTTVMPKLLMVGASAGLFGAGVKEIYDRVPEYDKTNYHIIPMGLTDDGKAVYVRVPQDELSRFVGAVTWKAINGAVEGDAKSLQQIFAVGEGFLPSTNAPISLATAWASYAAGKNPYDDFRGRQIIDDRTFSAGGTDSLKKMIEWSVNQTGFTQFTTYDDARDTTFESILKLTPPFNRILKISDFGLVEKERQQLQQGDKESSRKSLDRQEIFEDVIESKEGEIASKFVGKNFNEVKKLVEEKEGTKITGQDKTTLEKQFAKQVLRNENDPFVRSILSATKNADKIETLKRAQKKKTAEEYKEMVQELKKLKVISSEVAREANKE